MFPSRLLLSLTPGKFALWSVSNDRGNRENKPKGRICCEYGLGRQELFLILFHQMCILIASAVETRLQTSLWSLIPGCASIGEAKQIPTAEGKLAGTHEHTHFHHEEGELKKLYINYFSVGSASLNFRSRFCHVLMPRRI